MKYIVIGLLAMLAGCGQEAAQITSFEECVAAGNPVMESYPRQCRTDDGTLFVEQVQQVDQEWIACTAEELRAQACTMIYDPVCGDDGRTYSNACVACSSRQISAYKMGEC